MIKYNSNNINDWYFDTSDIVKVYRNNAVCYYKVVASGDTPTYDLCYAVVDDITQYQDTEFEDVFNKADNKWYKLNNLNQYEQYGIYGSGRTITYYDGKLTVDDGYEYMYSGGSWVNVGEVSGSTATLPNVPFSVNFNANNYDSNSKTLLKTSGQLVDVDAVITAGTPTVNDGYLTIASGTRATISGYQTYFNRDNSNPNLTIISKQNTYSSYCHMFANRDSSYNWMYRCYSNKLTLHGSSETGGVAVTTQPVVESVRVDSSRNITYNNYTNNTTSGTTGFSYGATNSGKFALFQGYATSTGEYFVGDFYWVYMSQNTLTDEQVQQVIAYNEGGGGQTEYPVYYDEKADPLNDLTFNTMEDALEYAYNNCVYDGMKATINGDRYYFDSEDENGWVKVLEYYKFEDVTPNQASGWTISGSAIYNPDPTYYDDFDLETTSTSYSYKIAKITIYGYDHFTYYLRAYSQYSAPNAYLVATNIDELSSDPTSMSYTSNSAVVNTYDFRHTAGSQVNLNNYRRVTYNNLDKTVEHTFYVVFYGRKYSNYTGDATILIPKEQTNENWEQVTFSASSNVASSQKGLYIDGNYATSGGTSYWYYRWMIGLPSGSHTSHTNYSSYDFCPNVTSSTFTSVAGNSRQVNFTYDSTTNKSLTCRLVDTSGNTLTPTNTVYYQFNRWNSCNVQSNMVHSFTTSTYSVWFKTGGRFSLNNSTSYPNMYHIYGYTPPTLGTTYYVDNYSSTFDITYTKLSEEAVTITYTTYDPSDVETPAFKTDITWPYSGGTTSSTTLTSYTVPYTYPYEVSQTSDKFSASTYEYTAGKTSRTISFTLYPNNREFATVADMEAYQYAWEGMKAKVGSTKYEYKNGEWVEETYTQYEYIRTQNAAKIYYDFITNFKPTNSHTIEVKVEFVDRSIDWGHLVSWYDGSAIHQFSFQTVTSGYQAIVRTGGNNGVSYRPTIGANNPTVYTLPLSAQSGTYSVNGGSEQTIQYNYSTMTLPANTGMCFFGRGTTSREKAAVAKMYYVKVYDGNGNLVKHYVPSDNNGTPCFYEIVDGEYIMDTYTGSYHGTLTLGPQV